MKFSKFLTCTTFFLAFNLIFISFATSQKSKKGELSCEITDEKDDFTKERTISTNALKIYDEEINLRKSTLKGYDYQKNSKIKSTIVEFDVWAEWSSKNNNKHISIVKLIYEVDDYLKFPYNEQQCDLMVMLSSDEVLTLEASSKKGPSLSGGWVLEVLNLNVTEEEWNKIINSPPKKFRINYMDLNRAIYTKDFEISEKNRSALPLVLKCLDDYLSSKT